MKPLFLLPLIVTCAFAQTTVLFSSENNSTGSSAYVKGPFPTNSLAVPDPTAPTGLQVSLPTSSENSCSNGYGAVCSNNALLNQIDGFSVNPRVMVCFSGPVDATTLTGAINLMRLGNVETASADAVVVPVNQLIYDPATNCAFGKPHNVLDQQATYLLTVAASIVDTAGKAVARDPDFASCLANTGDAYCGRLAAALNNARLAGRPLAASLFTTMTVTSWLEGSRTFIDRGLSYSLPAGLPWVFRLQDLQSMTWYPAQSALSPQPIPLSALQGVDSVAFGLLLSPNYLNASGPAAGTITAGPTAPNAYSVVSFHVFLPPAPKNGGKIPLVIYGHGLGDSQFGAPTFIASTLARNGFATLAFEITGHGFGSGSVVQVTTKSGTTSTELTPGRGVQLTPGQPIGSTDGCIAPGPFGIRDCARQSAVDLFGLVNSIRDLGGLGLNLDTSRIYFLGQSLGSTIGTLFMAVEPAVKTAVLDGDGGTSVDVARLGVTGQPLAAAFLASVGLPVSTMYPYFNDNYVFPGNPPIVNTVPGALADQAAFEAAEWIGMIGDPLGFATHLRPSPLTGVPAKNTLFQFGIGDLEVPNPTESAVVRAARGRTTTSLFLYPKALVSQPELATTMDPEFPGLPILPHRILSNPTIFLPGNGAELSIALAEQQQVADYFQSNGATITNPDIYLTAPFSPAAGLFAIDPAALPESLNFPPLP